MSDTVFIYFLLAAVVGVVILALINSSAAYRNGVTDGYGYSREPNCPGYAYAGDYLKKYMSHRWPELLDDGTEQRKTPTPVTCVTDDESYNTLVTKHRYFLVKKRECGLTPEEEERLVEVQTQLIKAINRRHPIQYELVPPKIVNDSPEESTEEVSTDTDTSGTSSNKQILVNNLLKSSKAVTWDKAKDEWSVHTIFVLDDTTSEVCACSHSPIRRVYVIHNKCTGKTALVGKECAKQFWGKDVSRVKCAVNELKQLTENPNYHIIKSIDAIKYFRSQRWITRWEYEFLEDNRNNDKPSVKQELTRKDINIEILRAMDSGVRMYSSHKLSTNPNVVQ